jgi:hypothetical protein
MPKLSIDERTKGKAVAALLQLFKAEPDFAYELDSIRNQYVNVLENWLRKQIPDWDKVVERLTQIPINDSDAFQTNLHSFAERLAELQVILVTGIDEKTNDAIFEYKNALIGLAYKWKLKAPWVGNVLIIDHVLDLTIYSLPEEQSEKELFITELEPLLPQPPLPEFNYRVNPYELMYSGREDIQDKFAQSLEEYERKLKSLGWQELPSAIEKHAYWWFTHYVIKKKYPDIKTDNEISPEGIKRAVSKFRKLLNIEIIK